MREHSPGPDHPNPSTIAKRETPMTKTNNDMKSTHESITDDSRGRSTVTRRLAMNMIVGTAAMSAAAGRISAAPAFRPVYAAIEAHKAAWAAYGVEVKNNDRLEAALPKDRRQSSFSWDGLEIVETDDPRWIAHERAMESLSN